MISHADPNEWLPIIQGEYLEMPGLHLTKPQVQRLWGLDAASCDAVVDALEAARFLKRTERYGYVLADGSIRPRGYICGGCSWRRLISESKLEREQRVGGGVPWHVGLILDHGL